MSNRVTRENLVNQLKRINYLSDKNEYILDKYGDRYCLCCLIENGGRYEVSPWLKKSEIWDCNYSIIRFMLKETDKPRSWE